MATVSYNASTRVATLTPSAALANSTVYAATVRGGATDPRVKDVAGNALAANATWSFTTVATADTTPPTVTANTPANGATGVNQTAKITATVSEAMDGTTLNANTIELRDPSNALVPAAVSYSTTNLRATLNPTSTLAAVTTYTVTVKGETTDPDPRVKDVAGNAMATSRIWSFTTR